MAVTEPPNDFGVDRQEGSALMADRTWRLDKHVPIAMLIGIGAQTLAIVWWAAGMSFRVDQLERQAQTTAPQSERLIKLETKFDAMIDSINELKALVRQQHAP